MPGPMQRIFRRRSGGPPPVGGRRRIPSFLRRRAGAAPGGARAGLVQRVFRRRPGSHVPVPPAGTAPVEGQPVAPGVPPQAAIAPSAQSFHDRGRLRRRLRHLRRARELGYRDLGGLLFDLRRFGRTRPDLVEAKLDALTAVDRELRTLEVVLDDRRSIQELREPGIASCPRCGALHSSESHFCPNCGLPLDGPRAMGELGGANAPPPQPAPAPPVAAPQAPTQVSEQPTPPQAPTQVSEPPTTPLEPHQASERGS